jgi:hypothetical protein
VTVLVPLVCLLGVALAGFVVYRQGHRDGYRDGYRLGFKLGFKTGVLGARLSIARTKERGK